MNSGATLAAAPSPTRSRSFALAGTFGILAAVTACVAFIPHIGIVAVSALYLCAFLGYMGLRSDSQGGYLFEVIVPLSVLSFFCFAAGTVYLVLDPTALQNPELGPYLLAAEALTTLGYVCLLVGYGGAFRATAPSPIGRFVPRNVLVYLVPGVLGMIGMSLQKFQSEGMLNDQGVSPALSFFQQFGPVFNFGWFLAWYMLWAKQLRRSVAIPLLSILSAMAVVVLIFTFGGKGLAVTMIGLPALAYYEVKRKLPLKSIAVVVLVFVFGIFPMYNAFRQVDRNLAMSRRVDQAFSLTRTWNSDKYMDASLFAFMKRMSITTSVAAIVSDTGRWVDYRYGETLVLAPIGLFIPRFLWPEKPNLSIGKEFGATFRLIGDMDRETYISPSMIGDFYWNFSIPGVVLGMWLMGLGYRWYYQRYGAGQGFDPIRKSVYYTLLPTALAFEGNVAFVVVSFIKVLGILVIFLLVFRRLGWLGETADAETIGDLR